MKYVPYPEADWRSIQQEFNCGSLLAKTVASWGYDHDTLVSFFNPKTYTTLKTDELAAAAALLEKARKADQKVFVYGDYDCDGITATAIMVSLLRKLGLECGYYIPNRLKEGYGLNLERVKQAREKGYGVLVTVDNGVSAYEPLKWARENGMTVLLTDHHQINSEFVCDVLLHPTLFPHDYHYLCGAGVAYMLAEYLGLEDDLMKVLAMVSAIGDVMEIKGINVQLVKEGLKILNEKGCRPISRLLEKKGPWDESDIAFRVVPRINAVGRLADRANANQLVRYLLSDNEREMDYLSHQIITLNRTRQQLTDQQYQKVLAKVTDDEFLLVRDDELHEGLIGLMASRLADELQKPCLIMTAAEGVLKGSGRSIGDFDITSMLMGFKAHTLALGGHSQACGLSIDESEYDNLKAFVKDNYHGTQETIRYYLPLTQSDISRQQLAELFSYRPFGQQRELPLVRLNLPPVSYSMLKNENQLKWRLQGQDVAVDVLSFGNNSGYSHYLGATGLSFIGRLSENRFAGNINYQIFCEEIY